MNHQQIGDPIGQSMAAKTSRAPSGSNAIPSLTDTAVVYFGNDWFAENRTSSHHIARRLAQWCPVLYVDSPGLRAPRASGRDLRRLLRKLGQTFRKPSRLAPGLWHCTIPQIPFRRLAGMSAINRLFARWALRRAISAVGFDRRISWFVVPHPGFLAGHIDEDLVVYYCIDDYAAHPGVDEEVIFAADRALTAAADLVFVAPPALVELKRASNPATFYSPHGVDVALFSQAAKPETIVPDRAAALSRPVIGFFGSLADWIDVELLEFLGRQRPSWTFLMIGHVSTDVASLKALPNFVFVGPQPYETLPGWAKAFDVAIMPYRRNRQVRNANPLKLREYLATGKPVVSVSTEEVERFAAVLYVADTRGDFLAALERAIHEDSVERSAARREAVAAMSWDARVSEIAEVVNKALTRKFG